MTRNKARVAKHKDDQHSYICNICKDWDDNYLYRWGEEITRHNELIHKNYDITLTDKEFEDLTEEYEGQIINAFVLK